MIMFLFVFLVAVDCGKLLAPRNGSMYGEDATYPNFVTFRCNQGFDMRGSAYRRCLYNGTWSGLNTTCEGTDTGTDMANIRAQTHNSCSHKTKNRSGNGSEAISERFNIRVNGVLGTVPIKNG